jgi:hypothetical protein
MASTTTNYGFDVPTSSDLVKNGATQIALLGQDLDTFLFRPFTRNGALNGSMNVWQRGTSIALAASIGGFVADRWYTSTGANQACTISRQATNDTTNLANIQYAMRYQRNSGQTGTGGLNLTQSFESINAIPYAGKQVTFSFYARAGANYSAASSALSVLVISGTGTDQNRGTTGYTGEAYPISSTATLTTTWQRFTYTGTIAATATELALYFSFTPTGTASTNDYYELTGVMLEVGNQASPYAPATPTYTTELAACQRYFEVIGAGSSGRIFNTTTVEHYIRYTEKRVAPSFALTTTAPQVYDPLVGTKTATGSAVSLVLGSKVNGTAVQTTGYSVLTAGNWAIFNDNYLQVSAEL